MRSAMEKMKKEVPDGGWGWIVVIGALITNIIFGLVARTIGIFYLEMLSHYNTSATASAWVTSVTLLLWSGLGPVSAALCQRFSCRAVSIAGSLFMFMGIFSSGFAPNIGLMYLSFGCLTGIGLALVYMPCYVLVNEYFDKKQSKAMALATVGSALGAFVGPMFVRHLFQTYSYMGAFIILSAIVLNCCISGALFRPIELHRKLSGLRERTLEVVVLGKSQAGTAQPTEDRPEMSNCVSSERSRELELVRDKPDQTVITDTADPTNTSREYIHVGENGIDLDRTSESATDAKASGAELNHPLVANVRAEVGEAEPSRTSSGLLVDRKDVNQQIASEMDPLYENITEKEHNRTAKTSKALLSSKKKSILQKYFDARLLTIPLFVATMIANMFMSMSFSLHLTFLPALAIDNGVSAQMATILLSILGLSDVCGRLSFGVVYDLKRLRPYRLFLYYTMMLGSVFVTCLLPLCTSFAAFACVIVFRGQLSGTLLSQRMPIYSDLFGKDRATNAFGWSMMFHAFGAVVGRAVGGACKDSLGSYNMVFYILGALASLPPVIIFVWLTVIRLTYARRAGLCPNDKGPVVQDRKLRA